MSAKGLEAVLKVVMAHSANDQPLKLLEGMTDIQNSETCQEFQLLFCGPKWLSENEKWWFSMI